MFLCGSPAGACFARFGICLAFRKTGRPCCGWTLFWSIPLQARACNEQAKEPQNAGARAPRCHPLLPKLAHANCGFANVSISILISQPVPEGSLSMGVRLPEKPRWLNASPIVPEPGRVSRRGAQARNAGASPCEATGCPEVVAGSRQSGDENPTHPNHPPSGGAVYELAAPLGQNLRRTWQRNLLRHRGSVWNAG